MHVREVCLMLAQAWQMNIGPRFVDVEAHVLPAPNLQYKERTQPMNTGHLGAWNLRQVRTRPTDRAMLSSAPSVAASFMLCRLPPVISCKPLVTHLHVLLFMQLAFNKPVKIPSWAVVSFTDPHRTGGDLQVPSMRCAECCAWLQQSGRV
jgi:hypothetical protein